MEYKFKVGDWVVGWHNRSNPHRLYEKAWQIAGFTKCGSVIPVNDSGWCTGKEYIRRAEPHEIPGYVKEVSLSFDL
jgi:hypothetical protein